MKSINLLMETHLFPPAFIPYEVNINLLKPLFFLFIFDVRRMNTSPFKNSTTRINNRTSYTTSDGMFLGIIKAYIYYLVNRLVILTHAH